MGRAVVPSPTNQKRSDRGALAPRSPFVSFIVPNDRRSRRRSSAVLDDGDHSLLAFSPESRLIIYQ